MESSDDDDDGIDEIPARPDQHQVNGNKRNQQKLKHSRKPGHREAEDDADRVDVALVAEGGNDDASAQKAIPRMKRKVLHPDPVGDAEGASNAQVPGEVTSANAHADEENELQRPKKKGKKGKKGD